MLHKIYSSLIIALSLALVVSMAALADNIANSADNSVDATYEVVALNVGSPESMIDLYTVNQNGDGKNGCNLTGSTTLVLNVISTKPEVASVSPTQITFTNCEAVNTKLTTAVTLTPLSAGTTKIEFSIASNNTGGTFTLDTANFTVEVSGPSNTAPVVNVTGVTGGANYEIGNVPTAGCSVTDAEDGTKTVSPEVGVIIGSLSAYGLGSQQVTCSYTDSGGLTTTASATYAIVDTGKPVITFISRTPAANSYGWNSEDVTVEWSCTDSGSGVLSDMVTGTITTEGLSQEITGLCEDHAGNQATNTVTNINIDKTGPSALLNVSTGNPGLNGWYISDLTIKTSGSDNLSNPVTCTVDQYQNTETSGATFYGTCTNSAGIGTDAVPLTVKLDKTGPTAMLSLEGTTGQNGWYVSTVKIITNGSDTISNPTTCTDEQIQSSDTAEITYFGSCTNDAGLSTDASPVSLKLDKTPPTLTPTLDKNPDTVTGWYNLSNGIPTVSFTCTDTMSGLAENCPQSYTFGQGQNQSYSKTIHDMAGNSTTNGVNGINVDTVIPTINASISPARPASGWWNILSGAPTTSFTCSDEISGISGTCPADHLFGEGENQSFSASIADIAGNNASAGVNDVDVDITSPSLTWIGGPENGTSYYFGYLPASPTCNASDALSGPKNCTVTGYDASVGIHSLTATSSDMAGNSYTETKTYTVLAWTQSGFYQPVDMNGVYNVVKNGSTVPLKFEVFAGTTELTSLSTVKSLTYVATNCATSAVTDEIETTSTGGTQLRYDSTAGQFIYNWKTPSTAGKCYRVIMTTQDGSSLLAYFKLK